jgi:hypothetical protein
MSLASDLEDLHGQLTRGSITEQQYQARKDAALDAVADNAVESAYRNGPRKLTDRPIVISGVVTDLRRQVGGALVIAGGHLVQLHAPYAAHVNLGDRLIVAGHRTPQGINGVFRNKTTGFDASADMASMGRKAQLFGAAAAVIALVLLAAAGYLIFDGTRQWTLRAILAIGSVAGSALLMIVAIMAAASGALMCRNAKAIADYRN